MFSHVVLHRITSYRRKEEEKIKKKRVEITKEIIQDNFQGMKLLR